MTHTLAWAGVLTAAAMPALFTVLPPAAQPWNVSVIGALSLFVAARLPFTQALLFILTAILAKDAVVFLALRMEPYPLSWVLFLGYAACGWAFLRTTAAPLKIGTVTLGASMLFFTVSNFASWLEQALPYGYSFAGLIDCFAAGVPFYRGTLIGDVVFSAGLFGTHAVLSEMYYPAEKTVELTEAVK
jgi:hypothetical protein